jgi:hypothetical protein
LSTSQPRRTPRHNHRPCATVYPHHTSRMTAGEHRYPDIATRNPTRSLHDAPTPASQSRVPCVYSASHLHQLRCVRVVAAEGGVSEEWAWFCAAEKRAVCSVCGGAVLGPLSCCQCVQRVTRLRGVPVENGVAVAMCSRCGSTVEPSPAPSSWVEAAPPCMEMRACMCNMCVKASPDTRPARRFTYNLLCSPDT